VSRLPWDFTVNHVPGTDPLGRGSPSWTYIELFASRRQLTRDWSLKRSEADRWPPAGQPGAVDLAYSTGPDAPVGQHTPNLLTYRSFLALTAVSSIMFSILAIKADIV